MAYLSDIEIAQRCKLQPISEIARRAHVDEKYLELVDCGAMAVVTSETYNAAGEMFEFTQSRHVPDQVCFIESAIRQKIS